MVFTNKTMKIIPAIISLLIFLIWLSCKNDDKQNSGATNEKKTRTIKNRPQKVSQIKHQNDSAKEVYLEPLNEEALNHISIPLSRGDSALYLTANMRADHRIFGYSEPNTRSEKLLLFSIFTNEVEKNPFRCKYGSYYDIGNYSQSFSLKYKSKENNFIKVQLTDSLLHKTNVYFEKKWVDIE